MAELAKRLRASTLSVEEVSSSASAGPSAAGGACSSAPAAGGEGAASAGAGGERTWLNGWAYWWNSIEGAWNEGYVSYEGNWCRPDREFLWDTLWWWDMGHARSSTFQGRRVNPYYVRADVAVEQSR